MRRSLRLQSRSDSKDSEKDVENQNSNNNSTTANSSNKRARKDAEIEYITYDKKIYYLTEFDEIANASQELLNWVNNVQEEGKIPVGFDMEWPFTFQTGPKKTALMQFAFSTSVCYLFQVWKLETLPKSLIQLIHHEKLLLHGNCIKNDLRKLGRDFPDVGSVDKLVQDCCDLGQYANRVLGITGRWSMARLVIEFLKTHINKSPSVRMSEWDKALSAEQQMYAAIDVYVSQLLYQKIKELEDKKKAEAESRQILAALQEDFKKEEESKKNDTFTTELLVEYEQIQIILNQESTKSVTTQQGDAC